MVSGKYILCYHLLQHMFILPTNIKDKIQYTTVERTEGSFQSAVTTSVSFTRPSQAIYKTKHN
jgi:hypothetical protein